MMHRPWRLAVYAVTTSLLTVGGIMAGMSAAHADGSASCSGSGASATCTVSAAITQPTSASVKARATVNGDATFTWSATCTSGSTTKTTSGGATAETPATDAVTLPFTSPDSCTVSATVTLPTTDATNTLNVDLIFTGTVSASPSPSASASSSAPAPAPVHEFRGYGGKCLDDAGNGSANRTRIIIWTCNAHDQAQGWTYRGGELIHNGKCANDQRAGGNGSKVILYACNGASNEIWTHLANGELVLKAHGGRYCLDDPAYSTRNGTQLIVYTCKDSANQRWYQP